MPFSKEVAEVRELLARLDDVDALFAEDRRARDLAEKLAAHADAAAERAEAGVTDARRTLHSIVVVVVLGLMLWTPVMAYGAVWVHERVRNQCYPGVVYVSAPPPDTEPWYCGIFPGTGRDGSPAH